LFATCHTLYGELGGVLTADHWQSPSFDGSEVEEAGDEQGNIVANVNDYKRDQHPVGLSYEMSFVNAYLQRSFRASPTVYATSSGMAALTVSALIVRERLPDDYRIAVGEHSYFQNHELLHMMYPKERLHTFDEAHPEVLGKIKPHAIFVDLLANDPSMIVADLPGIYAASQRFGHHVDIVVDATCASLFHLRIPFRLSNVSVIGFDSLNKFHQFGLDRVTGGIVWVSGILSETVYRVRDHSGLILSEASAATLPTPNAALLTLYMKRHERNALMVAKAISAIPSVHVHYAGLPSHPSHVYAKTIGFYGSFVAIELPGKTWKAYKRLKDLIVNEAKRQHVPLIAGSTFGTPVTRVYTWATQSTFSRQFLRISPGLENAQEMQQVCDIISTVLHSVV
jgi:cystathionine beta-lyase/cystathionine gamma-synthase